MATVNLSRPSSGGFGQTIIWTPLANGDDGQAWDTQDYPDISVQFGGTFGAGGTVIIEGCNEVTPTNWLTLNDPQGNAASTTSAKIEQLMENVRWVRPRVTGGDGTTAITVSIWAGRRR